MLLRFMAWLPAASLTAVTPLVSQDAVSPTAVIDRAPRAAWRPIPPEDLLIGTLSSGETVTIQLTSIFAPRHVANVRALASSGWWDDSPINRVQDNFVVQWGGKTIRKMPPAGMPTSLAPEYEVTSPSPVTQVPYVTDSWSPRSGFVAGWPVTLRNGRIAPAHCYGSLGVGRENPPDTGWGSELYVVIGQSPRQLDRNLAVVGRVIEGIEFLSGLPRGRASAGELSDNQVPVRWKTLTRADRLPADQRPSFEYLDTASNAFAAYVAARATYRSAFYLTAPQAIDLCNVRVPIRRVHFR